MLLGWLRQEDPEFEASWGNKTILKKVKKPCFKEEDNVLYSSFSLDSFSM
jgi:hypothetical protein